MHETALAANLLQIAGEAADGRREKVRTVVVTVGELAGVMPDALRFAFDALKAAAGLYNAVLRMEQQPVLARCTGCGSEYAPAGFPFICPGCGANTFRIIRGEEVFVKELEVEE